MLRTSALILLLLASSLTIAQGKNPLVSLSTAELDRQASALYNAGKYPEAFALYQRAADMSDPTAEVSVGYMYEKGQGVTNDASRAGDWYLKAAASGNVDAYVHLGDFFAPQSGAIYCTSDGLKWYLKAAEQGNAYAEYRTGDCYFSPVPIWHSAGPDFPSAMSWYKKAAENSNKLPVFMRADLMNKIGIMYENGYGVPRDKSEASIWYQKAINVSNSQPPARTNPAPSPAPRDAQHAPSQGTCAVIYEAFTYDTTYGTHAFWGAGRSGASLNDAKAAARNGLMQQMNGSTIDTTVVGDSESPGGGIVHLISGCGHAHGAVVGELKTTTSSVTETYGNGIYQDIAGGLADTTDGAVAQAMAACKDRHQSRVYDQFCQVVFQW